MLQKKCEKGNQMKAVEVEGEVETKNGTRKNE